MKRMRAYVRMRRLCVWTGALLGGLLLAAPVPVSAETVLVHKFENVAEDFGYPCEAEEVIEATLGLNGCEMWQDDGASPAPDVIITGKYRGG